MGQPHVSEFPLLGSVESVLRQGAALGIIADADLAGSEAAVIAAVEAKGAKLHVTYRPLVESIKKIIPFITRTTGNPALVTGGSLANIYAAAPGTWGHGFSVGL
ncbi:MAG TPA: hypothetical protein VNI84_12130 [Pyrinomonadaceae bacterium]|nr:hypothetical protein [Pyrinomonadaceae bacterium]